MYYDWVEHMTPEQRTAFDRQLTTLDTPTPLEDVGAPDWWHGEEEAAQSSMMAVGQLSQVPRG